MARPKNYKRTRFANRALARIEEKGTLRCEAIGQFVISYIKENAPYDANRRPERDAGPHLKDSYYFRVEDGDVIIKTRRRYWAFVEFGTAEHGHAQPHVRPALEAAKRVYAL